MDNMVTSFIGA